MKNKILWANHFWFWTSILTCYDRKQAAYSKMNERMKTFHCFIAQDTAAAAAAAAATANVHKLLIE